ncbi:hypothetical protein LNP05_13315 [Klebsiella pneumoniae subsp. pneumoniae]|nr:hypothetical protein [Klebsiella pneumoniae subsp. pneumoniae]
MCRETEQEERVQTLPRRKPRQLAQKVRVESAVVEPVAEIVPEAVVAGSYRSAQRAGESRAAGRVESVADQDENGESREAERYAASLTSLPASPARQRSASSSLS